MTNTIDGFVFDTPPKEEQIIELAHYHRKLLDEAIFHQEIHLGDYCLAQRKRVFDYARQLILIKKLGSIRFMMVNLEKLQMKMNCIQLMLKKD